MKKIMLILLSLVMLTGCGIIKNRHASLFVENNNKLALCSQAGDLETEFIYDNYTRAGNFGYIVSRNKKQSVIDHKGKEILPYKEGYKYSSIGEMIIAQSKKVTIIYDSEGEQLYKTSKNTKINVYGLPVINQGKKYTVLDLNGEVLHESDTKVIYASVYNDEVYSITTTKDTTILNQSEEKIEPVSAKITGSYDIIGHEYGVGYVLYDKALQIVSYVNLEGEAIFVKNYEVKNVSFHGESIILKNDSETRIISLDGKVEYSANTYYKNAKYYLMKNDQDIYGPHKFIADGKVTEVDHIQLSPDVHYVKGSIFPVYVQSKGFQYYNFEGKQAFDHSYRVAGDFDSNKRAVVSDDGKKYYMIDNTGVKLSKKYVKIEEIKDGYYAAYTTLSKFQVIDVSGKVVIKDYFIGESDTFHYDGENYLLLHKSGSTYVYETKEYQLKYSLDGECHIYDEIYLKEKNSKAYYTLDGDVVYER